MSTNFFLNATVVFRKSHILPDMLPWKCKDWAIDLSKRQCSSAVPADAFQAQTQLLLPGFTAPLCGCASRDFPGYKKYKLTKKNPLTIIFPTVLSQASHPPLFTPEFPSRLLFGSIPGLGFRILSFKVDLWMRRRGDLKCSVVLTPGTGAVWADEDWFCLSGLSDFLRNNLDQSPVWTIAAEEEEEDEEE